MRINKWKKVIIKALRVAVPITAFTGVVSGAIEYSIKSLADGWSMLATISGVIVIFGMLGITLAALCLVLDSAFEELLSTGKVNW